MDLQAHLKVKFEERIRSCGSGSSRSGRRPGHRRCATTRNGVCSSHRTEHQRAIAATARNRYGDSNSSTVPARLDSRFPRPRRSFRFAMPVARRAPTSVTFSAGDYPRSTNRLNSFACSGPTSSNSGKAPTTNVPKPVLPMTSAASYDGPVWPTRGRSNQPAQLLLLRAQPATPPPARLARLGVHLPAMRAVDRVPDPRRLRITLLIHLLARRSRFRGRRWGWDSPPAPSQCVSSTGLHTAQAGKPAGHNSPSDTSFHTFGLVVVEVIENVDWRLDVSAPGFDSFADRQGRDHESSDRVRPHPAEQAVE